MVQVQKAISTKGLPIETKKWGEILRNPFYCGIMVSVTIEDREPLLGLHEAIITQKEFKSIQEKLECKSVTSQIDNDIEKGLSLKGLMKCVQCGSNFSGYHNHKKNLSYYVCSNKKCRVNVPAHRMNSVLEDYLRQLIPKSYSHSLWKNNLKEFLETIITLNNEDYHAVNQEKIDVKEKINLLADKLLEGVVSDEIFKEKLNELEVKQSLLLEKMEQLEFVSSNPMDIGDVVYKIVSKALFIYSQGSFFQRKELLKTVFQGEFFYDKEKERVRTFSNSKVMELTRRMSMTYSVGEGIKKAESLTDSAFGWKTGLEPATLGTTNQYSNQLSYIHRLL